MPPESDSVSEPPFSSTPQLPAEFLNGLDPRGRYLYESVHEMRQAQTWLTNHAIAQAKRLDEVVIQTTKTNGGLTAAKQDIAVLKASAEEVAPVVKVYGFAKSCLQSRLFWVGAALCVFVIFPIVAAHAPTPSEFLSWAVRTLIGA